MNDEDITSYPVYKRARVGIGYLAQEASVFRKMTVEDNILSVLEMTKLSRKEQLEKLESLIAEFRLGKVRKNTGDRLSGGERRRTEIARCLAINPKFIMLDEPFADDVFHVVGMREHIYWLHCLYFIFGIKQLQVACLRGRIAADVNDAFRFGKQNDI